MNDLIIITGATSGLGLEFAQLCAKDSKRISIIGRQLKVRLPKDLQNYSDQLVEFDLSEPGSLLKDFKRDINNNYDKVILVLNAATIEPLSKIDSIDLSEFRRCFQVNFFSNVEIICSLIQAINLSLIELHIVFISTGATDRQIDGWSAYSISKASMAKFLTHLSHEFPKINVTIFDPGVFSSKIQDRINYAKDHANRLPKHVDASVPAKKLFALVTNLLVK